MHKSRDATTLLEVCVVLAMLGVLLSVVAISMGKQRPDEHANRPIGAVVRAARLRAMRQGKSITLGVALQDNLVQIAVLPSGAVLTDGVLPPDSTTASVRWEANASYER